MRILLAAIAFLLCFSGAAQNLVSNPGLEIYITCPAFGQFSSTFIDDWDKPSWGSTDYYHYNCPGIIPAQQVPRSGSAYAGIIGYNYGQEYREYMTGTLSVSLNPGAAYYCEFYVSLNDGYIQAIKEMGAHLSSSAPGPYSNALHIPLIPQVENQVNLLDDTSAWMRVSGYFLASGGEQYITIGNFNNDTNTTIVQVGNVGSYGSYYFVDDVWVSLAEGLGMSELQNSGINIFPNPSSDAFRISLPTLTDGAFVNITVLTVTGKIVLEKKYQSSAGIVLDVSELAAGCYFLKTSYGGVEIMDRIIKR